MIAQSSGRGLRRVARHISAGLAAVCGLTCLSLTAISTPVGAQATVRLPGHLPPLVAQSNLVGPIAPQQILTLALTLPLRNSAELDALNQSLYDPADPLYGKYLTSQQFANQFGPTQADYDAVAAYARAQGLTIKTTHPNRLVLDVEGTAQAVQTAFGVHLHQYKAPNGRIFRAPDADPILPAGIAAKLQGVIGLDTALVLRRPPKFRPADPLAFLQPAPPANAVSLLALPQPNATPPIKSNGPGTGPSGGFSPANLRSAYNIPAALTGTGQTLALYELDGYTTSDITVYEDYFNLAHTPLQNILVGGFNGQASGTGGDVEVTLDIDMAVAFAPGLTKILVYEAPNNLQASIDEYNKIATDNLATTISSSWSFEGEPGAVCTALTAEDNVFKQFVAQGQSFFIASGDNGAYYDGMTLGPSASSPNSCVVGGTNVTINLQTGAWVSETTWNGGVTVPFVPENDGGSGGGISTIWPIPYYQVGMISPASRGSMLYRNLPDVSLDADPYSGEDIVYGGRFGVSGGTSAATPLWAAFTSLVNQQRATLGKPPLGFPNPSLYAIARVPSLYAQDFHDIRDGSTNLFYPAVTNYDLATGLGTINGVNLLNDLANNPTPTPVNSVSLLTNGGFENGLSRPQPWVATANVINNSPKEPAFDGKIKAWLCGFGAPHNDTLYAQTAVIPLTATSVKLNMELLVDSQVFSTADSLTVQLRSTNGTVLRTLATYTGANNTGGDYNIKSFDITADIMAYKGQAVQIYLVGRESGNVGQTSFVVDGFSVIARLP